MGRGFLFSFSADRYYGIQVKVPPSPSSTTVTMRDRYEDGQTIRLVGSHGRIVEIGMATTWLELMDRGHARVPNSLFLEAAVIVDS